SLNNVLNTKAHTEEQADRLTALQQTFVFMQRDFEQVINRSVRDGFGDHQAALVADQFGKYRFQLTRTGLLNPAGLPRSNLQRVAYRLDEKKLYRMYWLALDQGGEEEPVERMLFDGVESMQVRYLGDDWTEAWPPLTLGGNTPTGSELPKAAEVVMELQGFGKVRRLFRIPPGKVDAAPAQGGN
ncbi:MAG: type II secretion system minor pseudopilin GspJ, partial [Gammaproteobacteria bacterium]|nr:type II secretion system minor pseudopilin GspJ [Gammaproteobacteria bacterium]